MEETGQPGSIGNRTCTCCVGGRTSRMGCPSLKAPTCPPGSVVSRTHRHGQDTSAPTDPRLPHGLPTPHCGETSPDHFSISPGPAPPAGSCGQGSPTSSTRASCPKHPPAMGGGLGMPRPGSCEQSRPRGSSSVHGALASPSGLKGVNEATQQSQKVL